MYDTKEWYITYADEAHIPAITDKEADYRRLWKTFYDTVAIQERINPAAGGSICRKSIGKTSPR